jgi:zinc protease
MIFPGIGYNTLIVSCPWERICPVRLRAFCALTALLPLTAALIFSMPARAQEPTVLPTQAPSGLGLGTVYSYTLENGLRVLVAPSDAADLVTLDVWMDAGTRRETAANNGAAHFIEHLLFKGTATHGPGQIDAAIEDLGGSLNAATSYDWAHFYVTVASADSSAALDVLSDALMHSALRPDDMEAERPVILNEMAGDNSTPEDQLTQAYNALEFPNHPYGRPIVGTVNTVSSMTRQTVYDFYHTYYVPGDATLVISGNVTPAQGLAMARKSLAAWPARPFPPDHSIPETPQNGIQTQTLTSPDPNAYLTLGFHAPSVQEQPDAWTMDLLLTYLGQGGNNLLQEDLQNKQKIVSNISANYLTQRDPGTLTITAECRPGDVPQVTQAILADLKQVCDTPLSEADLAAAKHALLASYLFDAQTTSGRADAIGFYAVIDSARYDTDYIQHFENVTPGQLQAIARKYLDFHNYTLVTMLPQPNAMTASRQ